MMVVAIIVKTLKNFEQILVSDWILMFHEKTVLVQVKGG